MKIRKRSKLLSLLLAIVILAGMLPLSAVRTETAGGITEVSTWAELKNALESSSSGITVKVSANIKTGTLNANTGLHQKDIITVKNEKTLDLNGYTVTAYVKYQMEFKETSVIKSESVFTEFTIRDSSENKDGKLLGDFREKNYEYHLISIPRGSFVLESGILEMECPSSEFFNLKSAVYIKDRATFNGGEVLTRVTSEGGEMSRMYSRRLHAVHAVEGSSVKINGGTFDRVVLQSRPTEKNRTRPELIVNDGSFKEAIAMVLSGDVDYYELNHLPIEIKNAFFLYSSGKTDENRLVLAGIQEKDSYILGLYDYRLTNLPYLEDQNEINLKLNEAVKYLITPNGAVSSDFHNTMHWYVRGNINQSIYDGGPIYGDLSADDAMFGFARGVRSRMGRVISDAIGIREAFVEGNGVEFADEGYLAPETVVRADKYTFVKLLWYISPLLKADGYIYANWNFWDFDEKGNKIKEYGPTFTRVENGVVTERNTVWQYRGANNAFPSTYTELSPMYADTLTTVDFTMCLVRKTGEWKKWETPYGSDYYCDEFELVGFDNKGIKISRQVDKTVTIDSISMNIDKPLVEKDFTSGKISVDSTAGYTVTEENAYWYGEESYLDLKDIYNWPAQLGEKYGRRLVFTAKDGYKFDPKNYPRVKVYGLNRAYEEVFFRGNEKTLTVFLYAYPSEMITTARGSISGLKEGKKASDVTIIPEEKFFGFNIVKIQRVVNGTAYDMSENEKFTAGGKYRVVLTGTGKYEKSFRNGSWIYDPAYGYMNTLVKLRMNNESGHLWSSFKDALYETAYGAYTIDVTPEPAVTVYDFISISVPTPWVGSSSAAFSSSVTGLPDGIKVSRFSWWHEGRILTGEPFESGKIYSCEIHLYGNDEYKLADMHTLTAYVNGIKARNGETEGGKVTILDFEIPAVSSSGISGKVESFLSPDSVTLSLYGSDTNSPEYTVTVPCGEKIDGVYTSTYSFENVDPGTYTMRVFKYGHAILQYSVTVGTGLTERNMRLYPKGDANFDGVVDITDAMLVLFHVANKKHLPSSVHYICDVTGDGLIDISDAMRILYYVAGKTTVL